MRHCAHRSVIIHNKSGDPRDGGVRPLPGIEYIRLLDYRGSEKAPAFEGSASASRLFESMANSSPEQIM